MSGREKDGGRVGGKACSVQRQPGSKAAPRPKRVSVAVCYTNAARRRPPQVPRLSAPLVPQRCRQGWPCERWAASFLAAVAPARWRQLASFSWPASAGQLQLASFSWP